MEYELSATKFDLRFIPDEMEFEEKAKESCTKPPGPDEYKPKVSLSEFLNNNRYGPICKFKCAILPSWSNEYSGCPKAWSSKSRGLGVWILDNFQWLATGPSKLDASLDLFSVFRGMKKLDTKTVYASASLFRIIGPNTVP